MIRTTIDLNANASPDADLPDPTVVHDDGDVVIGFEDLELRMSYWQFDALMEKLTRFWGER